MEPDVLRKNAAGTVSGFMPESMAWDRKLTAWATTRHGAVTGESRSRPAAGTAGPSAAVIAPRSASSAAVVAAVVLILTAPRGVTTHQASRVRRIEVLMTTSPSAGRSGGRGRTRCPGRAERG